MLIGEFSKLVKTTVKTLRYYDHIGLFSPKETDPITGYRKYTLEQLSNFEEIRQYRLAGLSVEQISRLLDGENREKILKEHQKELVQQEAFLRKQKSAVAELLENCPTNTYNVKLKELPNYTVCTCRARVADIAHVTTTISARFKEMMQSYPSLSLTESNYCCVTFTDASHRDADIEIEYSEAVNKIEADKNGFSFKTLKGGNIACIEHYGAYEDIAGAYAALFRWLTICGYQTAGAVRERFIHGAWDRKNEADWLIEIQVPILKQGDKI